MDLTEALFVELAQTVRGSLALTWGEHAIELTPPWRRLRFFDALAQALGVGVTPATDPATLARAVAARGIEMAGAPAWKLWKEVFERLGQPTLRPPAFGVDFPVAPPPLAKRKIGDPPRLDHL